MKTLILLILSTFIDSSLAAPMDPWEKANGRDIFCESTYLNSNIYFQARFTKDKNGKVYASDLSYGDDPEEKNSLRFERLALNESSKLVFGNSPYARRYQKDGFRIYSYTNNDLMEHEIIIRGDGDLYTELKGALYPHYRIGDFEVPLNCSFVKI